MYSNDSLYIYMCVWHWPQNWAMSLRVHYIQRMKMMWLLYLFSSLLRALPTILAFCSLLLLAASRSSSLYMHLITHKCMSFPLAYNPLSMPFDGRCLPSLYSRGLSTPAAVLVKGEWEAPEAMSRDERAREKPFLFISSRDRDERGRVSSSLQPLIQLQITVPKAIRSHRLASCL